MAPYDFLEQILRNMADHPARNAFYIMDRWTTYGELAGVVAGIQSRLEAECPLNARGAADNDTDSAGINTDTTGNDTGSAGSDHVGVWLGDDIHTYASILALWMSGRAFVPLNPLFPEARNRKILEQVSPRVMLHSAEVEPGLLTGECRALYTGDLEPVKGNLPRLEKFSRERDAYVLFTSGSTGIPKGVRISFRNLNGFVRDFIRYPAYAFTPDDRFLQIYDLSFDASVHCYTVPLAVGASVFTVPPDGIKYLAAYRLMQEHGLSFVKMPPSVLSYLRPHFGSINLPGLKYCLLGGEAFPSGLAREWESCVPNALIQNVYGPTEATINCMIYDWNAPGSSRKESAGTGSIGKGFGTNRVRVLGGDGKPVDPGETGELLVAGEQVSPGYWNNPGLNEKAFLVMEEEEGRVRYYRTGDLVREDQDGDVMYLGRGDEQIQVRGYRVEMGEIESAARDFLGGLNVMACGSSGETGEVAICLAVEAERVDEANLREYLAGQLPPYMIPGRIVPVPRFPVLVSGKLDRAALRRMLTI